MRTQNANRFVLGVVLAAGATLGLLTVRTPVAHAVLAAPSWWNGTTCDTANHAGSYSLGSSYNGVTACGPRPNYDSNATVLMVSFFSGAWGENEWHCVELVMRYMYLAYGIAPYAANGKDVVGNYSGSALTPVPNNGTALPSPGDIISESGTATNTLGHTAVITAVNVTNGTGTVSILQQNASADGSGSITVTNGILGSNVTGWLHAPSAPQMHDPITFGNSTDTPLTGDWANVGITNVGVWRSGVFYLRNVDGSSTSITFGNSTDTPLTGDWDGNATTDVGVWRAGTFYLRHPDGTSASITFGNSTDTPTSGHWSGPGASQVGVWRAGTFYLRQADGTFSTIVFGNSTDTPIIGDWDNNGSTDVGVWRAGTFYLRHPDGTYATIVFGNSTDTPTIGDWNGAGASQVGVWRSGVFYFNN